MFKIPLTFWCIRSFSLPLCSCVYVIWTLNGKPTSTSWLALPQFPRSHRFTNIAIVRPHPGTSQKQLYDAYKIILEASGAIAYTWANDDTNSDSSSNSMTEDGHGANGNAPVGSALVNGLLSTTTTVSSAKILLTNNVQSEAMDSMIEHAKYAAQLLGYTAATGTNGVANVNGVNGTEQPPTPPQVPPFLANLGLGSTGTQNGIAGVANGVNGMDGHHSQPTHQQALSVTGSGYLYMSSSSSSLAGAGGPMGMLGNGAAPSSTPNSHGAPGASGANPYNGYHHGPQPPATPQPLTVANGSQQQQQNSFYATSAANPSPAGPNATQNRYGEDAKHEYPDSYAGDDEAERGGKRQVSFF